MFAPGILLRMGEICWLPTAILGLTVYWIGVTVVITPLIILETCIVAPIRYVWTGHWKRPWCDAFDRNYVKIIFPCFSEPEKLFYEGHPISPKINTENN